MDLTTNGTVVNCTYMYIHISNSTMYILGLRMSGRIPSRQKETTVASLKAGSQYDAEPCVALCHDALCNCEHCAMVKTRRNATQKNARIDLGSIRAS